MKVMTIQNTRVYALLLLIISISTSTACFAAKTTANRKLPDALIWIDARKPSANWVSMTYPSVIKKKQAEDDLARLLKETGWSATNIKITNASVMNKGENPMTSIEFMTPEAVNINSGYFPIEPIIKALRNLKNIEILYLVPSGFQSQSVGNYENKYVKITLSHGTDSYRYAIQIKNSDFDSLRLPVQKQAADQDGSRYHPIIIALVILLALMAAFLAYTLTARFIGKTK